MAFSFNNDFSSPPDDISLFLRQLLHRSSSSSSSSSPAVPTSSIPSMLANSGNLNVGFSSSASAPSDSYLRPPGRSVMTFSNSDRPVVDCSLAAVPNAGLSFWNEIPARVCSNLTSSSAAPVESDSPTAGSTQLRSAENDADDYDCDSESNFVEVFKTNLGVKEGLEEGQTKQDQPRHSSKRSRAAEVHNQSEKRRRSRINEKMKALQNLIPNSNKTDKASMLDEAIEYLKQLQLQVQMLSMRNGLILHPMYASGFPEVLDPVQLSGMGMNFGSTGGSLDASIGKTLASDPDTSTRRHLDNLPCTLTAEAPFPLQSSMANQLSSFGLPPSSQSQNICREVDNISRHHLVIKDCQTTALESLTTMPTPVSMYNSQPSYTQGVMQSSSNSHNQLFSSNLNGLGRGRSEP